MNNPKVHLHKKMLTCITKKFTLETITIGDSLWMCAHWLVWLVRFIQFNLHRKEHSYSWSTPAGLRESFSTTSCLLLFPSPCQDTKLGNKTIRREKGIVLFMPINQATANQALTSTLNKDWQPGEKIGLLVSRCDDARWPCWPGALY